MQFDFAFNYHGQKFDSSLTQQQFDPVYFYIVERFSIYIWLRVDNYIRESQKNVNYSTQLDKQKGSLQLDKEIVYLEF